MFTLSYPGKSYLEKVREKKHWAKLGKVSYSTVKWRQLLLQLRLVVNTSHNHDCLPFITWAKEPVIFENLF